MQGSQFNQGVRRARARGFTMVELMVVVALVGILATIAQASVKKYVASSKATEANRMLKFIKTQQDAYYGEKMHYLNVSKNFDTASFFPANSTPGQAKMNFAGTGAIANGWKELGVTDYGPLYFVYATTAGAAGTAPTPTGTDIKVGNWPTTSDKAWYAAKAIADLSGNGENTVFVTGSFTGEIFSVND